MRYVWIALLSLLALPAFAQQQQVNCAPVTPCTTSGPFNTGTGDAAAVAFGKVNANFGQLYGMFGPSSALESTGSASSSDILGLFTSVPAHEVLAGPTSGSGALSLRILSTSDLSTSLSGVLKGNGSALTTAAVADILGLFSGTCDATHVLFGNGACALVGLTASVSGILPAANGGSGEAGTVTGVLKGNGASAFSAAAASDIIALWTFACTSASYLRGDGQCAAPGTGSSGGVTSDIQYNSAGSFQGASDFTYSAGGIVAGSPTGGAKGAGTLNAAGLYNNGVQVATLQTGSSGSVGYNSGCTSSPGNLTINYVISGNLVSIRFAALTCTASGTTLEFTGIPLAITPTNNHFVTGIMETQGTGSYVGDVEISSGGAIFFTPANGATYSGTVGTVAGATVVYSLD